MNTSSHWRQYVQHGITMDTKFFICENINIFGYLGARGGGGGFNNQTGPILVHIYPLLNNNVQDKYRSIMITTFWVRIKKYEKNLNWQGGVLLWKCVLWYIQCFMTDSGRRDHRDHISAGWQFVTLGEFCLCIN